MAFLLASILLTACATTSTGSSRLDSHGTQTDDHSSAISQYTLPPPARTYGTQEPAQLSDAEAAVWQMATHILSGGCTLDGALVRAARKHAQDVTDNPLAMEENGIDYLRFALRYFGSPDYLISTAVFELDDNNSSLMQVLGSAHDDWTHCGIGVIEAVGKRQAVFMAATRVMSLNAIPVQPRPGKQIDIRGKLITEGATRVDAFLEHPDGSVQQLKSFAVGLTQFQISVPIKAVGRYKLELQVTRRSGPETVLLVPLFAGVDVESRPSVFPGGHTAVKNPEALMTQLINRIRRHLGLAVLKRDKRLDNVAQRHCEEMVLSSTFGHFSRLTGALDNRLRANGVYPRLFAENIAQSNSMMRVHHNLMQSPSHKIKLLHPEYTHLGLGIVTRNGMTTVTQIFAAW
ncbi:MAG: CAP domain-containing protein [Deltaproteobacteria bacterium]|nr:CAP domain-containing protein [Deltaproteobacteria bacterium]